MFYELIIMYSIDALLIDYNGTMTMNDRSFRLPV